MSQTPVMLHTHWDREWYESAATYRVRLAQVMDDVLERLELGALPAFTLDGQTALIEDCVALFPEAMPRIKTLVSQGKLHVGPWFTAPDSWLVWGESLLRNLALGMRQATELGETHFTGYLPDTFGHPKDIPALLHHMGLNTALVWRGVSKARPSPFVWQGPDSGAQVLTVHLREGYFHNLLHDGALSPEEKSEQLVALAQKLAGDPVPALLPIGGDHLGAVPEEGWQVLKQTFGEAAISVVSPAEYMAQVSERCGNQSIPAVAGALMDNSDAYLLTGVWSARTELKRANRQCQHRLIYQLEPMLVWAKQVKGIDGSGKWQQWHRLWQQAWKTLLLNHPHDSICGCSTDAVHEENRGRFTQINDMLDAVMAQIEAVSAEVSINTHTEDGQPSAIVFSPWPQAPKLAQVVPVVATGAAAVAALNHSPAAQITSQKTILADGYRVDPNQVPLSHVTVPQAKGWLWLPESYSNVGVVNALDLEEAPSCPSPVQAAQVALSVRLVSPQVSCHVTPGQQGLHIASPYGGWTVRLTWQADMGDSYNRCPVPPFTVHKARCVSVEVMETGPLVCECRAQWVWDDVPDAKPVILTVQLKAGSPVVQLQWYWESSLANGLVQCVVNTHRPIQQVWTEAHLGVEGHAIEPANDWLAALPAKPFKEILPKSVAMQRYAVANGCWVITDGAPEVEITGSELAVSLGRTFGVISKGAMATRGGAAGPPVPTPQAQFGPCPLQARMGIASIPQSVITQGHWVRWAEQQALAFDGAHWAVVRDGIHASTTQSLAGGPLLMLDHPSLTLKACKPEDDGNGWLVRIVNTSSQSVEVPLRFGVPVAAAFNASGMEQPLTAITLVNAHETLPQDWRPYELKAFLLR